MKMTYYGLVLVLISMGIGTAFGGEEVFVAPPVPPGLRLGFIATIAGTGAFGYNGDEIPATEAELAEPRRIAFDQLGNVYIGDGANARIRYIDTSGIIHTFAGTGVQGYNGDGILATQAQLDNPRAVAVDTDRQLVYISEGRGNRIRVVDSSGIIFTYAGTGDPTADRNDPSYNGDEIPAIEAQISYPYGLALDRQGNLYIADMSNHRIRMIDTLGIIHTVAGTGIAGYNGDGILATQAELNRPGGVAVDRYGNLYIADALNNRIRVVDTRGVIHTIAGTGVAGFNGDKILAWKADLNLPRDVTVSNTGLVFIADSSNNRVRVVHRNGIINTIAGIGKRGFNGDYIPATLASLWNPRGVAIDSSGNLYIADKFNFRIRFVHLNLP